MDVMELLPSNVAVSKLLATEGFGRSEDTVVRRSMDAPVFSNLSATSCSSSQDTPNIENPPELKSVYSNKRQTDIEQSTPANVLNKSVLDNNTKKFLNGGRNSSLTRLPDSVGKQLRRKGGKVPRCDSPVLKKSRTDRGVESVGLVKVDDVVQMSVENGLTCASADKSRVVKWKHGRDGKRADKRNCRSTAKNKLDSFISRAGSTGSSSTVAGNNILGLYGLKSEVHDISKYMSDMSLKALVNGSCKSGEVSKFKMKQSSNANENILLSVKEACAILAPTLQSEATDGFDTRCDGKAHLSPLTCGLQAAHENNFDVKSEAKEASSSEGKELFDHSEALRTLMYNLQLCEPQEFLQRLALPQVKTLDSLLSQAPTTADFQRVPDQFSGVPTSLGASLPPFPWSLTPNVTCKPSSDPNKSSANKNTFQRRWIRIGANNKCSSHLDSKPCERIGVSSKLQIVDGPIEVSNGVIKCTPSSQIFDQIDQNEGLNTSSSCDPSDACFAERHLNSWNNPYSTSCWNKHFHFGANDSHDMKNHHGNEQFCMGKGSISQKIENIFLSTSKSKLPKPEYTHGASTSPSKFAADGCDLGPDKNSKHVYRDVGHSPRLVAAAETLYEIASCSKCSSGKQIQSHGSRRLPSKQQPKAMKAPKSRPSTVKDEACTAKAKPLKVKPATHPNKKTGKASLYPNEESNNKRTMTLVSDLHLRGPIKWPVPKYPLKLEANAKSLNMEFGNLLALLPSTSSGNQNFNNPPQKLKKVVVHVGPQSKDMARGRSKKD